MVLFFSFFANGNYVFQILLFFCYALTLIRFRYVCVFFLSLFFFSQEFLCISAAQFLCSAHLQICVLSSGAQKVVARRHFDASCQRAKDEKKSTSLLIELRN